MKITSTFNTTTPFTSTYINNHGLKSYYVGKNIKWIFFGVCCFGGQGAKKTRSRSTTIAVAVLIGNNLIGSCTGVWSL